MIEIMETILFAWLGMTDLRASKGDPGAGLGPIGQAVKERGYRRVVLLSNLKDEDASGYGYWLGEAFGVDVRIRNCPLENPMDFEGIYLHAERVIRAELEAAGAAGLQPTYHLSPGTPAMAAVWIIIAKSIHPAELIESSREAGVRTVSIPFDIAADYLPSRVVAADLLQLAAGDAPEAAEFGAIIHRCAAMRDAVGRAQRIALFDVPVLLLGESGTGKELFAKAIHGASERKGGPLVTVNCGAIPAELVESAFFGHEKGAFTGAVAAQDGYLAAADGGTIFLDEIGELPLPAQVKLLRALQEGTVTRLGSTLQKKVDVRVIAATNRDLAADVAAGRFREDLFHRLAVGVIRLPPLRERSGDLGLLCDAILVEVNDTFGRQDSDWRQKKLSAGARNLISRHNWPGNIRELRNTLTRAVIWSTGQAISERDLSEALLAAPGAPVRILDRPLGDGLNLQELLDGVARHYLARAVEAAGGSKTRGAELLGFPSYQTYTNWLKKHGLEPDEGEPGRR